MSSISKVMWLCMDSMMELHPDSDKMDLLAEEEVRAVEEANMEVEDKPERGHPSKVSRETSPQ